MLNSIFKPALQKIILGNLPLLGVSYQGSKKDEEYKNRFLKKDEMKSVIKIALENGVKFFAASSPDFNELALAHLNAIKEVESENDVKIFLIPCIGIPLELNEKGIDVFRRWRTHLNYESKEFGSEVQNKVIEDPILNCRLDWKENLSLARKYELKELEQHLKINWSFWEKSLDLFSNSNIMWIELGSEMDFLAISRMDLLEEILDRIRGSGYDALLGSHHFGVSVPLIRERRVKFDGYVTPLNRLGVMMFPTKKKAEDAVNLAKSDGKFIIGIKPFAGGRIEPKEALNYVYNAIKADSCMMGAASAEELKEDIQIANDFIKSKI